MQFAEDLLWGELGGGGTGSADGIVPQLQPGFGDS